MCIIGVPDTTSVSNPSTTFATATSESRQSESLTAGPQPIDPTHVPGFIGGPGNRNPSPTPTVSGAVGTKSDTEQHNRTGPSTPIVAAAVIGSIGAIAVLLLIILMIIRCYRSRRRAKNYNGGAGDSGRNLAGTTGASPEGAASVVTQRRGIIPSGAFFTDRLSAAQREQFNSSPYRSSSPTLGNDGVSKIGSRKAVAPYVGGAVGIAAMEGARHSPFQRDAPATSPIPEHPPQIEHPRASDAISVTSLYREDWPGPVAAGVDPLFYEEFPLRARTASPHLGPGQSLETATHDIPARPASNISVWPGPGVFNNNGEAGLGTQNPIHQHTTQHEDELPETIRPSPARTPQIHSAEIHSYPFPERQASPHTGFNAAEFPARKPVTGPLFDRENR